MVDQPNIQDYVVQLSKDRGLALEMYGAKEDASRPVRTKAQADYARHLKRAQQGDGSSFRMLLKVTMDDLVYDKVFGVKKFVANEEWRAMVTKFVDNPSLKNYGYGYTVAEGFVRNYAANALASRSLHMIKVSLAYCSESIAKYGMHPLVDYYYRKEVGEILLTELAKTKVDLERSNPNAISYR